jgi:hypothetical protein
MLEEIAHGTVEVFSKLVVDGLVRGLGYLIRRYVLFQRREINFWSAWTFVAGITGWVVIIFSLYWIITRL